MSSLSPGDNALIIGLRAYVAKLEYRLPTISEIAYAHLLQGPNEAQIPDSSSRNVIFIWIR